MGVGEILDVSIKLYLKNFWTLIKVVALVVIPVSLLGFLFALSSLPDGVTVQDGQLMFPSDAALSGFIAGAGINGFLAFLATLLATGAAFKALGDAYLGRHPKAGESLKFAGQKIGSLLWVALLTMIVILIGFLLLVIPGIYLSIALIVVVPCLMLEDARGLKALRRSRELVKGRWWRTFGIVILGLFVIPIVLQTILGIIFGLTLFANIDSVTMRLFVEHTINVIGSVVTTPFQAAVLTVLYFDLRVRKEAFDLELLAGRIGSPPEPQSGRVPPPPPA